MTDQIKTDVEALTRLKPQIDALVSTLNSELPAGGPPAGSDPALAALHALATETLASAQKIVAGWMSVVGEVCEAGRRGFITTDQHGAALMKTIPRLHRD